MHSKKLNQCESDTLASQNCYEHNQEELLSARDSAYFPLSQSCACESESDLCDISSETEDAKNSFYNSNTLSNNPSKTTSSFPSIIKSNRFQKTQNPNKPKKNVTILLPTKRTKKKPFGIHLQLESTSIFQPNLLKVNLEHGDVSRQVTQIHSNAKYEMMSYFPSLSTVVDLLFTSNTSHILLSISSTMIGDLMIQLRMVLFSPLLIIMKSLDVVLHVIIKFLHQVSLFLKSVQNCQYFPRYWEELYNKCKKYFYNQQVEYIITEVRELYIDMWCKMLEIE